jgi:hypothetical protein
MKYACLVYLNDDTSFDARSDDELAEIMAACEAWTESLKKGGHFVMSMALQHVRTAATVRSRDGRASVTDGPFVETKEHLGGLTVIEARDLNEAIHLVSQFPTRVGAVEVRPVLDPDAELTDPVDRRIAAAARRQSHAMFAVNEE